MVKVPISGSNFRHRSFNNDEIESALEKVGFEIIHPEKLSIEDQIRIIMESKIIVGASGAAFTNIIFCNKGTNVIVLANQELDLSIFSSLAGHLELKMLYLTDKCDNKRDLHSSFYIAPSKLLTLLEQIK